jgi:co-chaperonin GroES (HSP10)
MTGTPTSALPQAVAASEAVSQRQIRPLGEQIIIRVIPPFSVGSIIIPDSAKGSTHQGEGGSMVHFVEAEVVAVGPGRRGHDRKFVDACIVLMEAIVREWDAETVQNRAEVLLARAQQTLHHPLQVKPGDRILYHPAVQRFDRKIDPALIGLPDTEECYICNEMTSVLAILERE